MSLALWLRAGRAERGLSLEDVARVTKIQARILERLEGGKLEGLPAEVFVRGFIRSFAKCCGLDESEALTRYSAAAQAHAQSPSTGSALPAARAMVDAMAELAPQVARATKPVEVVTFAAGSLEMPAAAPAEIVAEASTTIEQVAATPSVTTSSSTPSSTTSKKKKNRGGKRAKRKSLATGTPSSPTPVVVAPSAQIPVAQSPAVASLGVEASPASEASPGVEASRDLEASSLETPVVETRGPVAQVATAVDASSIDVDVDVEPLPMIEQLDPLVVVPPEEDIVATDVWQPKMPPVTTSSSVPWRRPYASMSTATAPIVPSLVIDDSDPEHAAQVLEDREAEKAVTTLAQRRSFLPPILLDREDRSARQGGLTLAVIILLIAATLTLSYLMRRPSSSGDGVTQRSVETQTIG